MNSRVKLILLLLICMAVWPAGSRPQPEEETMTETAIFDFSRTDKSDNWIIINDTVMGGVSDSEFIVEGDSIAVFRGTVSLENNGGFASVRTSRYNYDLTEYDGISLMVRGDGKNYYFRLETYNTWRGIAYQSSFETTAGKWITVRIPFNEFAASFRGRKLREAPELDPGRIRSFGILISERQEGPFRLEIARIGAYSNHVGKEDK